ncbi:MAG TPA: hypothetical protein VFO66_07660 [Gemmatimonadaceae bacterium]|nr:hypothetical protein [Gemmatimonadaceae bacterium]
MSRRLIPALVALAFVAACSDQKPEVDAELARDLELATAQPATPQLNDGPLDAPAPAQARVESRTPRAQSPRPRVERPQPRVDTTTLRASAPAPQVEVEQQSAPARFRGVSAGTSFGLSTRSQVCTSNLPGDKFVATVTSAVVGEDGAVIPAGSTVVLEVASVTPGNTPETAQISLRVKSVVLNDEAHAVDGHVAITSDLERGPAAANGSDKKKVIGGAIAGAVIGQVMGRDTRSTVIGAAAGAAAGTAAAAATRKYHACLPAGASVRVTTSQPIIL